MILLTDSLGTQEAIKIVPNVKQKIQKYIKKRKRLGIH